MAEKTADSQYIKNTELFSGLPKNDIDFILAHSQTISLQKSKALFFSGEKAACFYILKSGEIRVFKKSDDEHEEETARFTSGDTIGDFDFARGAVYDAYAEAAEDSQLIVFPKSGSTIDSLASDAPDTVCNILLNAIIMMTGRIKATNKLLLENMSWVKDIHRRAYEDAGTGLWKQTLIADEIIGALKDPSALIMLKPDRFKILVDSRGHCIGDEAMIRIALILKNITRHLGHGWPLRLKSNETALIISSCGADQAESIAEQLASEIADMEPSPATDDFEEFVFSATVSWCVWPLDGSDWDALFQGNYANLLDTWKADGNKTVHFNITDKKS